jgi:hypothetical protein
LVLWEAIKKGNVAAELPIFHIVDDQFITCQEEQPVLF